ncbi:hypothetical protein [Williamsia muralis]|uniref:TAP-like protein n=1 Tax=Williamsia marianensis TaxID=85044 RepID=A0ABU4F0R8_WILMA|nr:hypothetical protein [Williamsia muralis]MDV7136551.1 hypothetical protein [Williamsia muralis]
MTLPGGELELAANRWSGAGSGGSSFAAPGAEIRRRDPGLQVAVVDVREAGHLVAGDDSDVFTAGLGDFVDRSVTAAKS